jgi:hypothetical protein
MICDMINLYFYGGKRKWYIHLNYQKHGIPITDGDLKEIDKPELFTAV